MNLKVAMKEIESHEFAARLNVASDLRTFLRAAQEQESVRMLLKALDVLEHRQQLLSRIIELSYQLVDPRYENQWDTALAVYVWVISLKDLDLAKIAAQVTVQAPQCWWTTKVAHHILLEKHLRSNAGFKQYEFTSLSSKIIRNSDAGETILLASILHDTLRGMTDMTVLELHSTYMSRSTEPTTTRTWLMNAPDYTILSKNANSGTTLRSLRL